MSNAEIFRNSHTLSPTSRGIHHRALKTADMKMTIDFYHKVLGMPIVHALRVPPGVGVGPGNRGNPPYENLRHYFFDLGGDTLLAFFELPKGAKQRGDRNALGAMQHCAFTLHEDRFIDVIQRLERAGIPVIGPIDGGAGTQSIYFQDPNDIRLEFITQWGDGDDMRVLERWTQTQDDLLTELRSVSDDEQWLASVTSHLSHASTATS